MKKFILTLLLTLSPLLADGMYRLTLNEKSATVYEKLLTALDKNNLVVISQIDILGKFKMVGLPKMFGKEFNSNKLTTIKAIIACNGYFGNYISNADPDMLGLCPIRLTVIEKDSKTTILFVKPTAVSGNSKANKIIQKLENKVISVLNSLK